MPPLPILQINKPPAFCQYAAGPCDQSFDHFAPSDIFAAYSGEPSNLAGTMDEAIRQLIRSKPNHRWLSWRELAVGGQIIFCEVCRAIRFARVFVADISVLNFNVLFEVGYAVGLGKPIRLLRDTTFARDARDIEEFGILDTIGYEGYTKADDIIAAVLRKDPQPVAVPRVVSDYGGSPIYVVLPPVETEAIARLVSALKQSAFHFRTFDAKETPRLAFADLQRHVASSAATVLPLLDESRTGAKVHNARCAFVAGIALARGLHVLLMEEGHVRQPIDYRDVCQSFANPRQIQPMVERLVKQVAMTMSTTTPSLPAHEQRSQLARLDLGDIAAENEDEQLRTYFVRTSQFQETSRGHARLVVGRKGTGKSAIFSQLRDSYIRRTHEYVVLDLRPEGYQLRKLVDMVRGLADASVREQLSSTLWYYVLLTELAYCVVDRDVSIAYRDPDALNRFRAVEEAYGHHAHEDGADFSDRLLVLIARVQSQVTLNTSLVTSAQVNETIWKGDLGPLTNALAEYLRSKKEIWLLVDNLDKSWPARGATEHELLVLRCLLEASRKLQRQLERKRASLRTVVFIRNDIFEQLISETPDRGKETHVSLDQTDHEVLRDILVKRAVASLGTPMTFDDFAQRFFDLHVGGEDAFRFLFRHTFGRARDVLRLTKRCVETALNRGHTKVSEDDMRTAVAAHSTDVLRELIYEVRDSFNEDAQAIEEFVDASHPLMRGDVDRRIAKYANDPVTRTRLIETLLWYSLLGVQLHDGTEAYAYEDQYNVERLLRRARAGGEEEVFVIHPAFRAALHIRPVAT